MGLLVILLLLHLCSILTAAIASEVIRLDCGATTDTISSPDNRSWIPDSGSTFMPPSASSYVSIATQLNPSVEQIPYYTARIFTSQFAYTFPLSSGHKFLRLYFYSASFSGGRDLTKSIFNVSAAGHTLLAHFSVSLSAPANTSSFVKEFVVHVGDSKTLELTFTPENSFAFINGIEIVSMPDNLYLIDTHTALETLYRLNVGGRAIGVQDDTGMFRKWDNDDKYLNGDLETKRPYLNFTVLYNNRTPAYTAPEELYRIQRVMGPGQNNLKYNMSWIFSVDSGFSYRVRLHFCEFIADVEGNNQRVFSVFIGDQIVDKSVDVVERAGGKYIPIFSDYVVSLPVGIDGKSSKQNLSLSLYPNMDSNPYYKDALLNGVEIFRLNATDGSLAVPKYGPGYEPGYLTHE